MTSFNKAMDAIRDMAADFYNEYDLVLADIFILDDRFDLFWNVKNVDDVERLMEQLRQEGFDVNYSFNELCISINF